jgi:hypothetical protein
MCELGGGTDAMLDERSVLVYEVEKFVGVDSLRCCEDYELKLVG